MKREASTQTPDIGRGSLLLIFLLAAGLMAFATLPEDATFVLSENADSIPCSSEEGCTYSSASYATTRIGGCFTNGGEGMTMASGDFDGDDATDLVIAFPRHDMGKGVVFIYYGNTADWHDAVDICTEADNIAIIPGEYQEDLFGFSLLVGNPPDGPSSLFIGAPGYNSDVGRVYILNGGSRIPSIQSVAEISGQVTIDGAMTGDQFGSSLALGAFSSETQGDLLVGTMSAGETYLVFGPQSTGSVSSDGDDSAVVLAGLAENLTGKTVSSAGDLNKDGIMDLLIGAPDASDGAGLVYLVAGRAKDEWLSRSRIDLSEATSDDMVFSIVGDLYYGSESSLFGNLGASLAALGDVNGDTIDDVAVGAPTAPRSAGPDAEGTNAGRLYVIFGNEDFWSEGSETTLSLSAIPAFFHGSTAYDGFGQMVTPAGDLDGDGLADILAGAPNADTQDENAGPGFGAAYILPGRSLEQWPKPEESSSGINVDDSSNIAFFGENAGDGAGAALLATAGLDLAEDDSRDFLIAATMGDIAGIEGAGRIHHFSLRDYLDADEDGQSRADGDCDDNDADVSYDSSGLSEQCDGKDNDCDSEIDEGGITYYADADSDGYGDAASSVEACDTPEGYVSDTSDCDDRDKKINPDGTEICNEADDDCDGSTDEGVTTVFFADADNDSFGDALTTMNACSAPIGYVTNAADCNDSNALVNPSATEVLGDGIDNNCDGSLANDLALEAYDEGLGCRFVPSRTSPRSLSSGRSDLQSSDRSGSRAPLAACLPGLALLILGCARKKAGDSRGELDGKGN